MANNEKHVQRNTGHGPGSAEKPKDFKLAINKLVHYLKNYMTIIVIAFILAAASSALSIVGPNKISNLTNKISDGLVINQDKMEEVIGTVTDDLSTDNITLLTKNIMTFDLSSSNISNIMLSSNFTDDEKLNLKNFISNITSNDMLTSFMSLSDNVKRTILTSSTYKDTFISVDDKVSYINLFSEIESNKDMSDSDKVGIFKKLPTSILNVLFTSSSIDGVEISINDKMDILSVMTSMDSSSISTIYSSLDTLPDNIKTLINPTMDIDGIKTIGMFLLIIYIISALFNFFENYIMVVVSNRFSKELRTKISVKINKLPLKYFDNHSYGDILSRVTNDVDTIGQNMHESLGTLVSSITLLLGSVIMMFATNAIMAITGILSSLIGFVFMIIILSKSQKYFSQRQSELGKLNGHVEEIYSAHNVVKAYNGEEAATEEFNKLNNNVFTCNFMSQFLSGLMQPLMAFIGNFSYVAVCVVGAILVMNNQITFGEIVAFIIYVRLFTSPLSQIAQGMTQLQTTAAASERVFEFIEEPEMKDESMLTGELEPSKAVGNIEFNHVHFGYDDDKVIIKDFSCKVKSGEKIAIVGPTGAGKTTMVNLLMKFYDINSGDIIIDGKSINTLTRENVHSLFVMVLQDTWLFNGTIRDNIKYNKDNISDEEIWNALKVVGVDHFVKSLPNTLDYMVGDSDTISAGQKQLLTIARGMLASAPFLILDEATSSVDTRTEELVQKAMDKLTHGRTSFIIAHRLSTIKNADLILVMKDGNIIEQGNHDELIEKNGFYAELYNSQFQN